MKIYLKPKNAIRGFWITDEHPAAHDGTPVAVVGDIAYGLIEFLPIWRQRGYRHKHAIVLAIAEAIKSIELNKYEKDFVRKFWEAI